uniref:Cytochrome b n=1 Tax=Asphondylia rosetta TaxID=420168 RepID=C7FIM7_9DIPT|nr:cytochrome b [Asphondylia rosetta]
MYIKMKNNLSFIKFINNSLINLPTPLNIKLTWNMGSLLGICLIIQLISGLFLAFRYSPDINLAFKSINLIMNESWNGFLIRNIHANGASLFFLFIYIHIGRGIYYKSFLFKNTWIIGTLILLLLMMSAFMGYVLPWGQMSFWGSTVITNLMSSIPYFGNSLVQWIWGGFSINNPTLTRFFCIHFIMPFIILMLTMIHIFFLHFTGSNNPLGINSNMMKIKFNPFFTIKDLMGLMVMIIMLIFMIIWLPYFFMDSDNFILANPMVTPVHIQPEWYFLFAYSILRAIPSKLGGVIALMMSIMILFFIPFMNLSKMKSNQFYYLSKLNFWFFFINNILLTWIGMQPVEMPFIFIGQMLSIFYFMFYFLSPIIDLLTDKIIN